ncbi:MAG: hypothetical protein AAB574_02105 [Patescibacteria group bacterium]
MKPKTDYVAIILLSSFFLLLTYAGYLSYQSIDWDVLKRLENSPIVLPTPLPQPAISTTSATPQPKR